MKGIKGIYKKIIIPRYRSLEKFLPILDSENFKEINEKILAWYGHFIRMDHIPLLLRMLIMYWWSAIDFIFTNTI